MADAASEKLARLARRLRRPARLGNWLEARRERRARPDAMRSLPLGIDLEPTTRCNLRCFACQRREKDWPENDLPFDLFVRILDQLPHLEQIKLQGIGEPFLHPRFFDLVREAKRRGIRVFSITNGTLLADENLRRRILDSGLDELLVSIDGATAETQARWRGGSDLDRIVAGLGRLVALRGRKRRPRIGIWTVANPDNLAELPRLVEIAARIGADCLTYQTQMTAWGKKEWLERLAPLVIDPESPEAQAAFRASGESARRTGLAFTIYRGNRFNRERPCFWPWESCFISAEGYVTRCCIISDPRVHNFGRIDQADFRTIWNCAEYKEFRRAVRENRIPPLCRPCYGESETEPEKPPRPA